MSYTPLQDGTQAFGIPDSPITINSVSYILEEININAGASVDRVAGVLTRAGYRRTRGLQYSSR